MNSKVRNVILGVSAAFNLWGLAEIGAYAGGWHYHKKALASVEKYHTAVLEDRLEDAQQAAELALEQISQADRLYSLARRYGPLSQVIQQFPETFQINFCPPSAEQE